MKMLVMAAALLALSVSTVARAAPIVLFNGVVTADIGAAPPLGIDPSLGNPNGGFGGGLLTGDIGIAAPFAGELNITITDLGTTASGRSGSVYQVLLDGNSLGVTSPTAVDASTFSTGAFSLATTSGFHDLGLWDFISTFQGFESPYGGLVDGDFAQANVSVLVTEAPEPATWALMGIGLVSLSLLVNSRRRAQAAV
jgi:hypothetical protein